LVRLAEADGVTEHRSPVPLKQRHTSADGFLLELCQLRSDVFPDGEVQVPAVGGVKRLDEHLPGRVMAAKEDALFQKSDELIAAVLSLQPLRSEPVIELLHQ